MRKSVPLGPFGAKRFILSSGSDRGEREGKKVNHTSGMMGGNQSQGHDRYTEGKVTRPESAELTKWIRMGHFI